MTWMCFYVKDQVICSFIILLKDLQPKVLFQAVIDQVCFIKCNLACSSLHFSKPLLSRMKQKSKYWFSVLWFIRLCWFFFLTRLNLIWVWPWEVVFNSWLQYIYSWVNVGVYLQKCYYVGSFILLEAFWVKLVYLIYCLHLSGFILTSFFILDLLWRC